MLGLGTRLGLTSKIKAVYIIRKRMRKTVSGGDYVLQCWNQSNKIYII